MTIWARSRRKSKKTRKRTECILSGPRRAPQKGQARQAHLVGIASSIWLDGQNLRLRQKNTFWQALFPLYVSFAKQRFRQISGPNRKKNNKYLKAFSGRSNWLTRFSRLTLTGLTSLSLPDSLGSLGASVRIRVIP